MRSKRNKTIHRRKCGYRIVIIKTYDQILDETVSRIKTIKPELEIDVEGSACRTLVQSICGQIANCYIDIDKLTNDFLVDKASGNKLNSIGNSMNVSRNVKDDDEAYRTRIVNAYANSTGVILDAIIEKITDNIPNVAQVICDDYIAGPGSFCLYLVPVNEFITASEIDKAKQIVNQSEACGILGMIKRANVSSVQINIRLTFFNMSQSYYNAETIKVSVQSDIISYLESLQAGQSMVVSDIISRTRNLSQYIIDVEIISLIVNGKTMIVRNYVPASYEVIRPAVNSPVVVS